MEEEPRQARCRTLIAELCKNMAERNEAVRLALLASISGESIFFLGPPGTAKSMVSRRLKCAFVGQGDGGVQYFEYLMNQFSTPDELFGPVSLKRLENDEYVRITKGYLPDAEVAFLDEIWKAGPAIQNTLLTIINEKKFHNGSDAKKVPLKALIAASNELPAENQGLEALWDRFLFRLIVDCIKDQNSFMDLICGVDVAPEVQIDKSICISISELEQWRKKIQSIEIPQSVRSVIHAIRQEMTSRNANRDEKGKFYVSDRRWKKIVHALKTAAFLNDRKAVDLMDCYLISYCMWNTVAQIQESQDIVRICVEQNGENGESPAEELKKKGAEFINSINQKRHLSGGPGLSLANIKNYIQSESNKIKKEIESEIQKYNDYVNRVQTEFLNNLFVDQSFLKSAMKPYLRAKEDFQKVAVDFDRYLHDYQIG